MIPLRPSSITSGTAPQRVAITGVPHAIDSIITRPNGSSHSIGNSVARACWSSSTFSPCVTSPRYSIRPGEVRLDELVEVLLLGGLAALAGELQRQRRLERDRDRAMRALVGAHPAEEEQVVAAVRLHGIEREVERVREVRDPVQVGLRLALVHRDRDQAGARRDPRDLLVELARLAVERPVDRVHRGVAPRRRAPPRAGPSGR